eukprot:1658442-Prymnesium_polylepis.1
MRSIACLSDGPMARWPDGPIARLPDWQVCALLRPSASSHALGGLKPPDGLKPGGTFDAAHARWLVEQAQHILHRAPLPY